ncbi:SPOR domain-containing protein, partial [Staphylococcus aureus]
QIGAYASPSEALKGLTTAAAKFPALAGHAAAHQSVNVNGKTLYRARFGGFDAASAAKACSEMKQANAACLAIKAE